MRYSGIQPQYFPRLHYFARILNADLFMIRDDCQFVRKHKYPDGKVGKSYQVQAPIKTATGTQFLTVPVKHNGYQLMTDTEVSYDTSWVDDHLKTLKWSYQKAPHYQEISAELTELLNKKYASISELNTTTILWGILRLLGEQKITQEKLTIPYVEEQLAKQDVFRLRKIMYASQTKAAQDPDSRKNDRIIALCKEVGANEDYCGGTATAAYVDHDQFSKNGITVTVQDWTLHEYPQVFSKQQGFVGNLSLLDLLMHTSVEKAQQVMHGKKQAITTAMLYGVLPLQPEVMSVVSEMAVFI